VWREQNAAWGMLVRGASHVKPLATSRGLP
jgi:hypothetical protein